MLTEYWAEHNRIYPQTPDGVNDYYVGINGTNSFSITPFQNLSTFTFHGLINFPSTINSSTSIARIFEMADSTRTNLFGIDVGAFTTAIANEYLGVFTNVSAVLRATGIADGGNISAGWHTIGVSVNASVVVICVDGIQRTGTNSAVGRPITISTGFTANKISLMGTTAGGVPVGCTWRDIALINTAYTPTNFLNLYNYYTRYGNVAIGKSDRTIWKFLGSSAATATIIALYQGNESGTNLLDKKSATRNLTKTNF